MLRGETPEDACKVHDAARVVSSEGEEMDLKVLIDLLTNDHQEAVRESKQETRNLVRQLVGDGGNSIRHRGKAVKRIV